MKLTRESLMTSFPAERKSRYIARSLETSSSDQTTLLTPSDVTATEKRVATHNTLRSAPLRPAGVSAGLYTLLLHGTD